MKQATLELIRKNSLSYESHRFGFPGPGITTIGQYSYFFDVLSGNFYRCLTCLRDIQFIDCDGRIDSYWVKISEGGRVDR